MIENTIPEADLDSFNVEIFDGITCNKLSTLNRAIDEEYKIIATRAQGLIEPPNIPEPINIQFEKDNGGKDGLDVLGSSVWKRYKQSLINTMNSLPIKTYLEGGSASEKLTLRLNILISEALLIALNHSKSTGQLSKAEQDAFEIALERIKFRPDFCIFPETIEGSLSDSDKLEVTFETLKRQLQHQVKSTNNSIEKLQEKFALTFDSVQKKVNEQHSEMLEELKSQIKEEASAFESLNKELSKQLALNANVSLSNQNIAQADKEKSAADILRIIGACWLICLSIYTAIEFDQLLQNLGSSLVDFKVILVRWLIVFLLTLPGIYLLRESSRHRSYERKYRQLGVQLATINSYLKDFKEDEKLNIKKELTSNFFSVSDTKIDDSSVPDLLKSFEKSLDAVIEIAKRK